VQQQKPGGLRGFVQKPIGKIVLILIAILVVFASYTYVQPLLAIPAILLFGLAIPIWLGLKRPRFLALVGLVIILVVAPTSSLVLTQDIRQPISAASSLTDIPGTNGNALLQNASVAPYTGSTSTNFTWTVTVYPSGLPKGNSSAGVEVALYVSTCPGATSPSPPNWCSAGYPFYQFNQTIPGNLTSPTPMTFHFSIGSNGIWDWQMGVTTYNSSTHRPFYQNLVGDPTYNALEGPVVGDYWTTYGEIVPTVFLNDLVYLGLPFYVILLIYMLFKNRERRRKEAAARAAGPVPPTGSPSEGGTSLPPSVGKTVAPGVSQPPPTPERTCPKCNAVVYENETTCWKCGAPLTTTSSAPLP
jgi:hypothetical protein